MGKRNDGQSSNQTAHPHSLLQTKLKSGQPLYVLFKLWQVKQVNLAELFMCYAI
jgi:hypothetical protein